MKTSLFVGASLLALAGFAPLTAATAAPMSVAPAAEATGLKLEPVQYRGYCRDTRARCAARWGFGGWRYRRCVSARGCL